jgi:hypothetical protein
MNDVDGSTGENTARSRREEALEYWKINTHVAVTQVAKQFGIPASTLYHEIKQRGLKREAAIRDKRERVAAHFSGVPTSNHGPQPTYDAVRYQADQDVADMESCLGVARMVVVKYHKMLMADDALIASEDINPDDKAKLALGPRGLKIVVEGTATAMEMIRRIRGLDGPLDWNSLSDEQLEKLAKGQKL